uniref:Flavin-containing monooxygenase n=1 Tax=Setaria italica TaxID=4555 RepID=K3ZZN9_SETIT
MATDRPKEKVCVVGAGMSGLAAARELRREGLEVTVMEQRGDVGGQWLYDPRTDADDPLGATAPVKVHGSVYASVRLISPRECMGLSNFQFVPRPGRDARRFPGHREVYWYLKDFCAAFGLEDAVRLNTRVVRVAMAPPREACSGDLKWLVRSVHVEPNGSEDGVAVEEVFDAVVVASGHYSQPRLPSIKGMESWRRRQLHTHSYREPEPFRGEVVVVVVVGCGASGLDIAMELCGVANEVYLAAKSVEDAARPPPAVSKMLANHADIRLHPPVDQLCDDGTTVAFADGSRAAADAVIYCTGYRYSFPFLDTGGIVAVDDGNRVGPLYEHTFPPALAPSLSFVGVPMWVFAPWFFEAQARWVALVLSGKAALLPEEEMLRALHEDYRAREIAGVPAYHAHAITAEVWEFVYWHSDLPRMEDWKVELFTTSILMNLREDRETFRDRDDDSESVREGLRR